MRCPTDGSRMALIERNGVQIDYCPHCRGVWLDGGELDEVVSATVDSVLSHPSLVTDAYGMDMRSWDDDPGEEPDV